MYGDTATMDDWESGDITIAAPPTPVILTTALDNGRVGTTYPSESGTLQASSGSTPYTWSLLSGSLPTGLGINTSGVISGTPTASGTFNFNIRVTDAQSQTDDQALSIIILPYVPGGSGTTLGTGINDTFIGGGDDNTNWSTSTELRSFVWPAYTPINFILIADNTDIQALPDTVYVEKATLRLRLTGNDASGGYNPTTIGVYSLSGTLPDLTTVTGATFTATVSSVLSTASVTLTPGWFEWDVTVPVRTAYAASEPIYLLLKDVSGAQDTNRIFASMEHATTAWRPELVITYMNLVAPEGPSISAPGKIRVTKMKGTFR